jgi:branched-subunit amino acid aminotransferase/4-amino-4-deoxychorismate lyase
VNIKKNSQENPEKQSVKISLNNMSNNLNGNISRSTSDSFDQFSRGFFYGDGLFESIRVFDGIVPFIHLHWERLEKGMRLLGFNIPSDWSGDFFRNEILKITSGNARVKISVWRSPGGLYHPTDQTRIFSSQPTRSIPIASNGWMMASILVNAQVSNCLLTHSPV